MSGVEVEAANESTPHISRCRFNRQTEIAAGQSVKGIPDLVQRQVSKSKKTPDAKAAPIRRATLEPGVWDWGFLPFMLVFRHGTGRYGPSSMVWRRSSGGRLGDVDLRGNSPAGAAERVRFHHLLADLLCADGSGDDNSREFRVWKEIELEARRRGHAPERDEPS